MAEDRDLPFDAHPARWPDSRRFVKRCSALIIAAHNPTSYSDHIGHRCDIQELQLRDAKATLSAVIDKALAGQISIITRHGRREAVVLSFEAWERLSNVPSFGRLLMEAPIEPGDLPERNGGWRETDF